MHLLFQDNLCHIDILKDVIRKIMVLSRQHQFVDGMQCTDSTGNCKHHQVLKLSKFYAYEFLHFDLCHFITRIGNERCIS